MEAIPKRPKLNETLTTTAKYNSEVHLFFHVGYTVLAEDYMNYLEKKVKELERNAKKK